MDEQPLPLHSNRSTVAAQFHNRLHRGLNILRSRWWVMVLCAGVAVGVEMYRLRNTPPLYSSSGRMILSTKDSVSRSSGYAEELNNFFGTQVALMQSEVVSNRVSLRLRMEKPSLVPSPVSLEVTVSPKTSIFNLRAVSGSPDYVGVFLQTVMEEYCAFKKEMLRDASDSTKSGLQQARLQVTADLQLAKQELEAYGASNSVVFLQSSGNSAGEYLGTLTKQLADLQSELQLLRTLSLDENAERLVGLAQKNLNSQGSGQQNAGAQGIGLGGSQASSVPSPTSGPFDSAKSQAPNSSAKGSQFGSQLHPPKPSEGGTVASEQSPGLVGSETDYLKAKQMILMVKAEREDLGKFLRPKHPKIIALNEEIDHMEKLLAIFQGQTKDELKDREHTLAVQIENLQKDIKVWEVKTVDVSKKMTDYQAIKDRIQRLQTLSDSLFSSESTVDVEKQISHDSVSILEPATSGVLAPPQTARNALMAAMAGLGFAVALLLCLDRFDDRPNSYSDLQDLFDETILGQIPRVRVKDKKVGAPFLAEGDERHALVEAYRNLRSAIVFLAGPNERPRTILVTSAIPGDGKSMTAANLAITLARSGSRVLLVDADLRRGQLHKRFEVEATPGLTEVLSDQCTWDKTITQNSVPNLDIIPRGTIPTHPGELFMKSVREIFLNEASGKYDFIVIDTPPVMAADDVSNLAPYVDAVLMVIRANWTPGRVARAALDLLYMRKAKVLGIVFNGAKSSGGDYYYYKYKEYYNKSSAA